MIVHETAIHQLTVESKLRLRPSTMNQSPLHNRRCKMSRKNVEQFIKHDNRRNLLKNGEQITIAIND